MKKIYKILLFSLLSISTFFIVDKVVFAEQYNLQLSGTQYNNYNFVALGWNTSFYTENVGAPFKSVSYSDSGVGSVQFFFDQFTIPDSVEYGYFKGYIFYLDYDTSRTNKPSQVRLNYGDNRTTICSVSSVSEAYNTYNYNSETGDTYVGTISANVDNVHSFTCLVNSGYTYNNIEIVNNVMSTTKNNIVYGINTYTSFDYYFKTDSVSSVTDGLNKVEDSINKTNDSIKENTEAQKETNDLLKDSSTDSDGISSLTSIEFATTGPLSVILNLPVRFFDTLLNNLDANTCGNIEFPLPFVDMDVSIPCVRKLLEQLNALDFYENIGLMVGSIALFNYFIYMGKQFTKMQRLQHTNAEYGGM